MIETDHAGLIFFAFLSFCGGFMVSFSNRYNSGGLNLFGMILLLSAGFMAGALQEGPVQVGTPANASDIAPFHELQIVKRIDRSLSVVKSVDGNDERIVKGIPEHVLKGEVFMVREDGTVIVSKSTTPPVTDSINGEKK